MSASEAAVRPQSDSESRQVNNDKTVSDDLELSSLVEMLMAEQVTEDSLRKSTPELEATQSRLRAEFKADGEPCLERLQAIGASKDFQSATAVRNLNFGQLIASGISSDLVGQLDRALRELWATFNSTQRMLESIPRRITNLLPGDIEPSRYREHPNAAQRISIDIRNGAPNVKEVSERLSQLKGLIVKLAKSPRRSVEMFHPDLRPVATERNPVEQITR